MSLDIRIFLITQRSPLRSNNFHYRVLRTQGVYLQGFGNLSMIIGRLFLELTIFLFRHLTIKFNDLLSLTIITTYTIGSSVDVGIQFPFTYK